MMKTMDGQKRETVLRFKVPVVDWHEAFDRFFPKGQYVLNRTEWRGKEARSCAITHLGGISSSMTEGEKGTAVLLDLEVTCRPKGWITYTSNTRYDGWTAMMLDRKQDGTLLDGHGNPLHRNFKGRFKRTINISDLAILDRELTDQDRRRGHSARGGNAC